MSNKQQCRSSHSSIKTNVFFGCEPHSNEKHKHSKITVFVVMRVLTFLLTRKLPATASPWVKLSMQLASRFRYPHVCDRKHNATVTQVTLDESRRQQESYHLSVADFAFRTQSWLFLVSAKVTPCFVV